MSTPLSRRKRRYGDTKIALSEMTHPPDNPSHENRISDQLGNLLQAHQGGVMLNMIDAFTLLIYIICFLFFFFHITSSYLNVALLQILPELADFTLPLQYISVAFVMIMVVV